MLLDELLAEGLAPRTARLYVQTVDAADSWCRGHGATLDDVPASLVLEYAETKPRTHSSRKLLKAALAAYWRTAGRDDAPLAAVRVPRRRRMRCRALEPDEAARLEATARNRDDDRGLVVLVGLYLGFRREEIASMRWEHFDENLGWVRVIGKGDVEAELPVHPVLVDELERRRPAELVGWVFPGRFAGRPIAAATVWEWCRRISVEAGLEPVPPHQLRHTCLATMNDATGDLRAVQEFARHSRPETTAGYTRVTTKRMLQMAMALDYQLLEAS